MGFYYTPFWVVWLGVGGLVHGPWPEQNHPMQTEPGQRYRHDVGGCSIVRTHGSWLPVYGPRHDGPGTPGHF